MNRRQVIASLAGAALPLLGRNRSEGGHSTPAAPIQMALPRGAVTKLGGFPGHRMDLNISARLLQFDIDYYVGLVENHRWRDWNWVGEQPGKWLEAAILCSETSRNEELHDRADAILKRMLAAQQADGYLGVTETALRRPEHPLRGMDAYELYFTLHALLAAHEQWGSDPGLASAGRLGDYFIRYIGPGKCKFWPKPKDVTIAGHEVHHGLEGTLLIDPMMRLYQNTGEKRYLDWCEWVVANIDKWSGTDYYSKLDNVARGELGMNQLLPKVHAHTFQMNALGLMRIYSATGDSTYLNKVRGAWNDISTKRTYITGAPSHREYYWADYELPNEGEGVETCSVMSWIQLNQALLQATGDPAHADMIERAMWNHTYASQTWDGDGFRYGVPLAGWKPSMYFTGPNCCSGSGPRMLGLLARMIYSHSSNAVYVNQFVDSTAQLQLGSSGTIEMVQRTEYPNSDEVALEIRPAKKTQFELKVRMPSWCGQPSVAVNGTAVPDVRCGSYATIHRTWNRGDTVELRLPMETKWVKGEHGNAGLWALTRGPVVYVADGAWQNNHADSYAPDIGCLPSTADGHPADVTEVNTPPDALGPFYNARTKLKDGTTGELALTPFGNLGRWYTDPGTKPDIRQKLYRYSVWLRA
ncbi:MAG: glycoside hydrolase family 127 protein [Bryobacteraceae bacterium]